MTAKLVLSLNGAVLRETERDEIGTLHPCEPSTATIHRRVRPDRG